MTRNGFMLTIAAWVASTAQAVSAPPRGVPPANPPDDAPGRVRRAAPAPVLGAGLSAIVVGGAALVGWWLRRRRPADKS
jgi:hypothetical protein